MTDAALAEIPHAPWKPKANPWLIAVAVTLATFMEVLDTTIVNVALPHIAGSMSASADEATWALTSYLVANGIVLTISGWLGDLLGRKRYFLICIAMFTVCSFLCGAATSLSQLIVFRLAQGFFGGGMQPNQHRSFSTPSSRRGAARPSASRPWPPSSRRCSADAWRLHHRRGFLALIFFLNVPSALSRSSSSRLWSRTRRGSRSAAAMHRLHRPRPDHRRARLSRNHDGSRRGRRLVQLEFHSDMAILSFLGITGAIAWLQVRNGRLSISMCSRIAISPPLA